MTATSLSSIPTCLPAGLTDDSWQDFPATLGQQSVNRMGTTGISTHQIVVWARDSAKSFCDPSSQEKVSSTEIDET